PRDRDVAVAVDEAGHDEPGAPVDHVGAARDVGADGGDASTVDDDHGVLRRGRARRIEQRAAANRGGHGMSALEYTIGYLLLTARGLPHVGRRRLPGFFALPRGDDPAIFTPAGEIALR